MLLSQLIRALGLGGLDTAADPEITAICPDSRRIKKGELYLAVEGLHTDGHKYVGDAIKKGAAALVVSKNAIKEHRIDKNVIDLPIIEVDDTRIAASRLYSAFYGEPQRKLRVIGVTGTNGKTSVAGLIAAMLTLSGKRVGSIGTTGCFSPSGRLDICPSDPNANMTTPDPEELYKILDRFVRDGAEFAVMEVTSHALSLGKVEPIDFEIGVFTNLSEDHLDFHENMESYFAAKSLLFKKCRSAVINYDDRYGRKLADKIEIPTYKCTAEGRSTDCYAEDIKLRSSFGIEYKLVSREMRLRVRSLLSGSFNVMNTMQAAVTAHLLGVKVADIKETLAGFSGVTGRLERVKTENKTDFSVYIDYAHTPDALENLIRTARSFAARGQRIVLLFGCGGDRERQKRAIMGNIATSMADLAIITSDNSRSESTADIIADILSGVVADATYTVIEDRREAIEYAIKNARRGDIILLAGKGHEEYEIDREGKKPFSEKQIVKEAIERYLS
ncbi:MAG: UDP-N-acetylmuramoyl-L-alanyl-D-glutamate--2,6-diaminopimelate ligase [Clostridia bacterium]|nr:UDP-N-acetylmuramoyl-L-alanyl-D-glutamate--2,6-diaminopimelate ligase [Clostridia bacterium]